MSARPNGAGQKIGLNRIRESLPHDRSYRMARTRFRLKAGDPAGRGVGAGGYSRSVAELQHPRVVDRIIRQAMGEQRLLRFWLDERERIAEPHDYGIRRDTVHLLVYQVAGDSKSGGLPDWRWVRLARATGFELLDRKFGRRPRPADDRHTGWDRIFLQVEPAIDPPAEDELGPGEQDVMGTPTLGEATLGQVAAGAARAQRQDQDRPPAASVPIGCHSVDSAGDGFDAIRAGVARSRPASGRPPASGRAPASGETARIIPLRPGRVR